MELLFAWDSISKAQSVELQSFTCTEDWPRTPHGRKLPKHPCEWEWAAQRHVRNLGHHLRAGDSALVGRDESGAIGAALHLSYESKDDLVVVTIKVGAVCLSYRRLEGRFAGDDLLRVGDEQARKKSADRPSHDDVVTSRATRSGRPNDFSRSDG